MHCIPQDSKHAIYKCDKKFKLTIDNVSIKRYLKEKHLNEYIIYYK